MPKQARPRTNKQKTMLPTKTPRPRAGVQATAIVPSSRRGPARQHCGCKQVGQQGSLKSGVLCTIPARDDGEEDVHNKEGAKHDERDKVDDREGARRRDNLAVDILPEIERDDLDGCEDGPIW